MSKRTMEALRSMQNAPLEVKVLLTKQRIREWVSRYGEDGVYISFSGGKDSTVLSHIVDDLYPGNKIPRVHVRTGLEYPEIEQFCETFPNLVIVRPSMSFKQVIEKYGYPFISKEVSEAVGNTRTFIERHKNEGGHAPYRHFATKMGIIPDDDAADDTITKEWLIQLSNELREKGDSEGKPWLAMRFQRLMGNLPKKDNGKKSQFSCERYQSMLWSPYRFSNQCCNVMKKHPAHKYAKDTGRHPMTGQMADESRLREQQWLKNGCNGFDMKEPISNPMSFWTENDVLAYIVKNNVRICSVYGDVVALDDAGYPYDPEMLEALDFDLEDYKLTTTGCKRTGCMFCGYGAHCRDDNRFVMMKSTHPQLYHYIFKPWSEGGLAYKEVIDWLNENVNLHIKY